MQIRRAEVRDLQDVRSLLTTRGWGAEFNPDRGITYIALDSSVIGCVQVIDVGRGHMVLDMVLVDESRRRQGIGTALVETVIADHPRNLYVSCRQDAVAFYEALGFTLLTGGIDEAPRPVMAYWRHAGNRAPLAMAFKAPPSQLLS